jgi:hypothetical protein
MKLVKTATATSLAILLALVASSIAAVVSSGTTISAYAQQGPPVDVDRPEIPELPPIPEEPEIPEPRDFVPCLPPPECLLPGSEVCIQVCWPFPEPETEE